jgi:hypothetical protein
VANAAQADSCPFVLDEATHPVESDALAALGRAIALTDAFTSAHSPAPEVGGEPPHVSPDGPASSLGASPQADDDAIARWFRKLAATLTDEGWSGVLRPQPWGNGPDERRHAEPWLAVTLALAGWTHSAHQGVIPPWHVRPDVVPELVDVVLEWTRGVDGDLWFTRLTSVRGEEPQVAEALRARFTEPDSRGFSTVHRQGTTAERRARFSSYGHLTLEERSSLPLEQRMADLRSVWADWTARVDRSATTGDVGPGHPSWFLELARRDTKLPTSYYPHGRHLDDRRVPDACVEQVLTQAHLDAANDLSDWRVEEVAAGRFLVAHPRPSRWFLSAPPGESGTRVDPEILAKAREDFGPMVLTGGDL